MTDTYNHAGYLNGESTGYASLCRNKQAPTLRDAMVATAAPRTLFVSARGRLTVTGRRSMLGKEPSSRPSTDFPHTGFAVSRRQTAMPLNLARMAISAARDV